MKKQAPAFKPTAEVPAVVIEIGSKWKEQRLGGTAVVLAIGDRGMITYAYSDAYGVPKYQSEMRDWNFRNDYRLINH